MKKRILIVGNNEGLPGVKIDIQSYKQFFKSPFGGNWIDGEIIEKLNVSKISLISELNNLKSMKLDYLIVVFSGHGGQELNTVLELNSSGDTISENDLKNLAVRQLNIYDCCRCYAQLVAENVVNELKTHTYSVVSTRERYENRIMQAMPQQVLLYACSVGEVAHDTAKGGAYSKNLISCAYSIENDFKLVGAAHDTASILTSMEFKDQHPIADLPRCLSSLQLIIGIKP